MVRAFDVKTNVIPCNYATYVVEQTKAIKSETIKQENPSKPGL